MTDPMSDKQQVELKPFDIRKELAIYRSRVECAATLEVCSFSSYANAVQESDEQAQKIIGAWSTRHSPDREKIREALALLENEFDHGGECDHCNEPMTEHRDTCPIGNTIYILKQLTL